MINMGDTMEKLMGIQKTMDAFGAHNPEAMRGFKKFMTQAKKQTALSPKMKELIGIGIAIHAQCELCIIMHVKSALDSGATKDEIIDAALVAATLGGGPAIMHTKIVFDALDDLVQ